MKTIKLLNRGWLLSFLLILCSLSLFSQQDVSEEAKYKRAALEMINEASTVSLITLDKEGYPSARMMQTLATHEDFIIWLATKPNTKKIKQVKQNSRVSLYYTDENSTGYVCIQGKAVLVEDAKAKQAHWKEGWEAYYTHPETDMILIKIIPERMEMVSYSHGIISTEKDWAAKKIKFD